MMTVFMFTISTIFLIVNTYIWSVSINIYTVFVISIGLILLGVGNILAIVTYDLLAESKNYATNSPKKFYCNVDNKSFVFLIILLILFYVTYSYFLHIWSIAQSINVSNNLIAILTNARLVLLNTDIDTNFILQQGLIFTQAVSYIFIFIFIYKVISYGFKYEFIKYLFPVVFYIFQIILSTSRTPFIRLSIYIFIITLIILRKKNGKINVFRFKTFIFILVIIFIFAFSFYALGALTGKTDSLNFFRTISVYIGSPIIGLDRYLRLSIRSEFFGKETLYGLYNILRRLGFDVISYRYQLEFIRESTFSTNIYTSLRRYISDYGLFGMLLIQFLLGYLYGLSMNFITNSKKIGLSLVLFSAFFFPIIESVWEERFLNIIISSTTIYLIVYITFVYFLFFGRHKNIHILE